MTRVLRLMDPRATDVGLSGHPMATLARLAADGVPVPAGFIVTTECGALDDPEVEAAVFRGYDDLGDGRGAVPAVTTRSSPGCEDKVGPSAAGMFATVLEVVGLADLFAAIDECRRSALSEHARSYVGGPAETHMAVGVMRMVRPEVSGVTFTRCPLGTGRMVVETVRGPLAPLLDGSVIPEHLQLWPDGAGVAKRVVGEHGPDLLDEALLELIRDTCLHISDVLRSDVGVEWAVEAGQLTVLQARAVTGFTRDAT